MKETSKSVEGVSSHVQAWFRFQSSRTTFIFFFAVRFASSIKNSAPVDSKSILVCHFICCSLLSRIGCQWDVMCSLAFKTNSYLNMHSMLVFIHLVQPIHFFNRFRHPMDCELTANRIYEEMIHVDSFCKWTTQKTLELLKYEFPDHFVT